MRQLDEEGRYRLGAADLLTSKRCVLEGAVPPIAITQEEPVRSYGWVSKGLPTPATGGLYVVEFFGKSDIAILAYIDPFGRVFSTSEASAVPPARTPDLTFARVPQQAAGEELGCVYVHESDGSKKDVAQYRCASGRYALFDSWYDFGPYGMNLTYEDAMARAYLAFVLRPSLGAPSVPERGIGGVFERLKGDKPLTAMRSIVEDARCAEDDPVCKPPALVSCLAHWLTEAGLDKLAGVKDEALRLVRTVRYANTYYLGVEDGEAPITIETVWAIEAALNRFLLVSEAFGDRASMATEADCARWDAYLLETVAAQRPVMDGPADAPAAERAGEWSVRCAIGAMLERLRLPVRLDASMRFDVEAGAAAFDLKVPGASLMPSWAWREESGWVQASERDRDAQAHRYALHLGLVLAAAAFDASSGIRRVDIVARPCENAAPSSSDESKGEFPRESSARAFVQTTFARETYEAFGRFEDARAGDPLPPYAASGAIFDVEAAEAFAYVDALPSHELRLQMPEVVDGALADDVRVQLGAERCKDMRITFQAARRRMAEGLADEIVRASSTADAIRLVRAAQEEAAVQDDDRTVASCTRLMAALAEGEIGLGDQNAVVARFLGEDRCLAALGRARSLSTSGDQETAVQVLIDAVGEAAALDGFVDGATTVYRSFDSYASRVLYNRARAGAGAPSRASADAGKRVEVVPDSYYLCHLEITQLLEHSFERTEEALRFGQRAIELGPATAAGYRQLGRAYMLVGDMENAAAVLEEGLLIAVQPSDIAMAYYQLAYVLWKAGRPQAGAACYLKSLMTSSSMAMQATAELQELVEETGVALPPREVVDEELAKHAVPVAPTAEVLEALDSGASAAVDAGMFPVARNLLALRLRYRPDDALVNVLRSLGE